MTCAIYRPHRNWGARILDYTVDGMRLVILENELLRIGILAGKGADIVELNYKPRDVDLVWLTPAGVRNPIPHAATMPDARGSFEEIYPGGWQTMFPNPGLPREESGIPFRFHGEVSKLPWDVEIVEDTPEACEVAFSVMAYTSPCRLVKTIRIESGMAGFRMSERVVNESPFPTTFKWGQHIVFGHPFVGPGSRIELPEGITVHALPRQDDAPRRVGAPGTFPWPIAPENGEDLRILPERGSVGEMLFMTGFSPDDTWYEVSRQDTGPTCRISWDSETMPVLWFWQEFGHESRYPWFGRVYTAGLELSSTLPSTDLGTELSLEPGADRSFWLELSVRDDDGSTQDT